MWDALVSYYDAFTARCTASTYDPSKCALAMTDEDASELDKRQYML